MKIFSQRMRELRGALSQVSAARKLGISQQAWAKYETSSTSPSGESITQICSRFNVSADWLLGLSERRDGAVQTVTDPELVDKVAALERENAKLKEELLSLKGENAGLNAALNKAMQMLAERK
jgi:transcriptional regulator with XRE-family HTH domain